MFQLHCTEDVLAEAIRCIRKRRPKLQGKIMTTYVRRFRANLDEIIEEFSGTVPFTGADEDDYHVHAAAIKCRADFLLTVNSSTDFTSGDEHYEVIKPDDFFLLIINSNPDCLLPITHEQLTYWKGQSRQRQLDEALYQAGCPGFADEVRRALCRLAQQPG